MALAERILDAIAALFRWLAGAFLAAMLVINTVNIAWRAVFDTSFNWVFPWTLLLFVWMLLFGFYAYVRGRRDVVVDVLAKRLPRAAGLALALFADVVGILVMLAILRAAPQLIALQTSHMEAIDLPMWVRSLPLFVSAGLILTHLVIHIAALMSGRAEPFPAPVQAVEQGAVE